VGAALIGAHPYDLDQVAHGTRCTARFATDREWAAETVDALELVNRHEAFPWVAEARLPAVASGDFHHAGHLRTWKTGLPCSADAEAVVEHLRLRRPAHLVPAHAAPVIRAPVLPAAVAMGLGAD
jgi:hypothetical protein